MNRGYRFIEHTADFGLEIFGPDEKGLFEASALALFDLIFQGPVPEAGDARDIVVVGDDWADLMVNWLRELLYIWNGEERLVCGVTIASLVETRLQATLNLANFDAGRHEIRNEIKAVTYHQISVGPYKHGWRAKVIFDI